MRPSMRHRRQTGAFDFMLVLWISLGVGILYLGITFIPAYAESWEIKQVVREAANMGWKNIGDASMKDFIIKKASSLGSHYVEGDDGAMISKIGTEFEEDDIEITHDTEAKKIHVVATYKKAVYFPFTKKFRMVTFTPSATESTDSVNWDK